MKLTKSEWKDETLTSFHYVYLEDIETKNIENIEIWCNEKLSGWWYKEDNMFIFETTKDRTVFLTHYKCGVWNDITVKLF